jgi:metal transporter CNNM
MSPFVLVLMWILAPVAWPTARLLDYLLGEDHGTMYKKAGLKTLVTLHRTLGTTPGERLNKDEVTIITAVLDLKDKSVGTIMTPMADVFTLSAETVLDEAMMNIILAEGYSRIPIHSPDNNRNFIGMLLVKMLITYDPEDCLRVRDCQLATLPETRPETSCLDIVNFFQEGKSHMVLVSDFPGEPYGALGVVTLEDVIEELIGEEIIDESDVFIDVHKAIRRMPPAPRFRVPKSDIVVQQEPGFAIQEEGDIEETKLKRQSQANGTTDGKEALPADRKPSMPELARSPNTGTTLLMRRRSNSGQSEPIAVRSTAPDIRQHLKHLGPSNRATSPKQTRINTVKIKPGIDQLTTLPETGRFQIDGKKPPSRSQSLDEPADAANENASLLSAGHRASDAVHALTYGTVATSPTAKSRDLHHPMSTAVNDIKSLAERGKSRTSPSPLRHQTASPDTLIGPSSPPSQQTTQSPGEPSKTPISDSTYPQQQPMQVPVQQPATVKEEPLTPPQPTKLVIEMERQPSQVSHAGSISPVAPLPEAEAEEDEEDRLGRRRGLTRSGSITEQVVDTPGGFRKLVLEMTSSSEEAEVERREAKEEEEEEKEHGEDAVERKEEDRHEGPERKKKRRKKKSHKKKKKHGGAGSSTCDGDRQEGVPLLGSG